MQTKRWALLVAAAIVPLAALIPAGATTVSTASLTCSASTASQLTECFTAVDRTTGAVGTVRLTRDLTLTNSTLAVDPGVWLKLDLAGHRLDVSGADMAAQAGGDRVPSGPAPAPAISVPATATLSIADSVGNGRLNATGGTVVTGDLSESYPMAGTAAGIGTAGAAYGGRVENQPPGAAASGTVIVTGGDVQATGGSISISSTAQYAGVVSSTGAGIGTGGSILVGGGPAGPVYVRGGGVTATGGNIGVSPSAAPHTTIVGSTGAGVGSGGAVWVTSSADFGAITANPLAGGQSRLTATSGSISTAASVTGTSGSALGAGGVGTYCFNTSYCHIGTSTGVKVAVFDTHGGSAIRPQTTSSQVTRPTVPVRTGWLFTGWYTSATEQHPGTGFDFTKAIRSNVVIHAGWTHALP